MKRYLKYFSILVHSYSFLYYVSLTKAAFKEICEQYVESKLFAWW